jgi:hypothetical protein
MTAGPQSRMVTCRSWGPKESVPGPPATDRRMGAGGLAEAGHGELAILRLCGEVRSAVANSLAEATSREKRALRLP